MGKRFKVLVTVVLITLLMNPALFGWGNPPPGKWEKVAQTPPGAGIIVYTKDGAKQRYDFVMLDDDVLRCANSYSRDIRIERGEIDKVIAVKAGKYAKHGALWGAVGGAAVMEGMALKWGDIDGIVGYVMLACVGAALGAGGGFLAGAAIGAPGETIYISKEKALAEAN